MKPRPVDQQDEYEKPEDRVVDHFDGPDTSELEIEKKWIQRAQNDPDNFGFLYRKYRPKVYRWIRWSIRDEDVISNLADETFSQALDNIGKFKFRGYSLGAWLFRIARNLVAMEFRKKKLRREVPYDPDLYEPESSERPDRDLEAKDETEILMICLEDLKPECKEVMINFYDIEMTTKEISIVMEIPEPTVKSHLQRGRKQLRKCLIAKGVRRGLSPMALKVIKESAIQDEGWKILGAEDEKPRISRAKSGDNDE